MQCLGKLQGDLTMFTVRTSVKDHGSHAPVEIYINQSKMENQNNRTLVG